ncbi:ABC transporter permease [Coprothermobacteraceae bacterium]|nr:ABC transporter permease [Coprothermobacteraceae bacterium]
MADTEKKDQVMTKDYEVAEKSFSFWGAVWRRFRRHKLAMFGLWVLVIVFLFSFVGPVFYTKDVGANIFEEDVAIYYEYKIEKAIAKDPALKDYLGVSWEDFKAKVETAKALKQRAEAGDFEALTQLSMERSDIVSLSVQILSMMSSYTDASGNQPYANYMDMMKYIQPPGLPVGAPGYPLGTDDQGRDLLARLMFGGKVSFTIGIVSALVAMLLGTTVGLVAGYAGGLTDALLMRFVDIMLSIPTLPLLLALAPLIRKWTKTLSEQMGLGVFGSIVPMIVVLAVFGWMGLSRLVRGQVLSLKEQQFVEAARAIGAPTGRILTKHLFPNTIAPVVVATSLAVAGNILTEASLSFLGFGVQPPATSWGQILNVAINFINSPVQLTRYWNMIFVPGTLLFITILSFNFAGDGLRDAVDPRMKL